MIVFAQLAPFAKPVVDWHALAPEIVLTAGLCLLVVADVVKLDAFRRLASTLAGWVLLGAMIPILTLAWNGDDRSMFGGAFVVDNFALILKATFLLSAYVVVLLSTNYVAEGDYWENEYYEMLLASVLGMVLMASARDLITMFVALELLSIPAYLMATWRKRDLKSNEAGLKYYLMGVFASSLMLYGMSLLFGVSGSTLLTDISRTVGQFDHSQPVITLGIILVVVGFAFKVSSFPFHTWAPDTYEGAPTPVTSFLAVASKTAGFVALLQLVFVAFPARHDVYEPLMWVLAAGSMTFGNLVALRQKNIVRLMAYSGIAQAGYMLAPLVVVGRSPESDSAALEAIVTYLAIYAAMNLGAFAVIIAVARKTRTADIDSYRGLFQYAPGLTVAMTVFLMSLAGIPPLGGWFAKFQIIKALVSAKGASGVVLTVVVAVNSVIALFYYAAIARRMWADDVPDGDRTPVRIPPSLLAALGITAVVTLIFGVFPQMVGHLTEVTLASAGG
ncbi:MAG: NADH-quinone oxidoreductase subunit N [Actinobacteria bacterium]|nr:MAG: NADH-quinone oxidoreductase subunit N [Actinomycetota bacterium]